MNTQTNLSKELEELKHEIYEIISKLENNEWEKCEIIFDFPPFINRGYSSSPSFFDKKNDRIRLIPKYSEKFRDLFFGIIFKYNQDSKYNQIEFFTLKNDYENSTIEILFNQEVEDEFQSNLPKSEKGKTIPWYISEKLNNDGIA